MNNNNNNRVTFVDDMKGQDVQSWELLSSQLSNMSAAILDIQGKLNLVMSEIVEEPKEEKWSIKKCYEYLECSRSTFNTKHRVKLTEYKEQGKAAKYSSEQIRELKEHLAEAKRNKLLASR
mgnify:FL=1